MTAIEWTDETWNPVTGCTRVSPGCANCYIERTPPFRMAGRIFARVGNEETTGVQLHPDRLEKPLTWRKPRRVFVCSLADLFHEEIPDEFIDRVWTTMLRSPQHTFQVLTKRPERAREWIGSFPSRCRELTEAEKITDPWRETILRLTGQPWPLPNVWLGVSIENARYTWRADVLREIPAAVRFVSAEPLLGSLFEVKARTRYVSPDHDPDDYSHRPLDLSGIDWLIAGGESGPGARPMHPDWARELRDACQATRAFHMLGGYHPNRDDGTAFFFKQWGEWTPTYGDRRLSVWIASDGSTSADPWDVMSGTRRRWLEEDGGALWRSLARVYRLGKKPAGRLLDGREWNEYPEART